MRFVRLPRILAVSACLLVFGATLVGCGGGDSAITIPVSISTPTINAASADPMLTLPRSPPHRCRSGATCECRM